MANPLAGLMSLFGGNQPQQPQPNVNPQLPPIQYPTKNTFMPNMPIGIASLPGAQDMPEEEYPPQVHSAWKQFDKNTLPQEYISSDKNPDAIDALNMKLFATPSRPQDANPKTGLETTPKTIDTGQAYAISRAMAATKHLGTAQLPPETIGGMLLQEGRPDLGNNFAAVRHRGSPQYYDDTQPAQEKMFNQLTAAGVDKPTASWLTVATAKQNVANRLKIPFGTAWNGSGVSSAGQSGAQYARELQANTKAAQHPVNAQMLNLIKQGYAHGTANPMNIRYAENTPNAFPDGRGPK